MASKPFEDRVRGRPTLQVSPEGSDFSIQLTLGEHFLLLCPALSRMPSLFVTALLGGCLSQPLPCRG